MLVHKVICMELHLRISNEVSVQIQAGRIIFHFIELELNIKNAKIQILWQVDCFILGYFYILDGENTVDASLETSNCNEFSLQISRVTYFLKYLLYLWYTMSRNP